MRRPLALVLALALAVALLGAIALFSRPPTRPSSTPAPRPAPPAAAARPALPPPATGAPAGLRTRRFEPDEEHAALPATSGPPVPVELQRPHDGPLAAEAFVEDRVLELLLAIEPTLDPATLAHGCTDDGRHCTFEGPWLGDDFVRRWVKAISEGATSLEALEGVRFTGFRSEDRADGRRVFVLEAHAP
jgi:hypothetical protein